MFEIIALRTAWNEWSNIKDTSLFVVMPNPASAFQQRPTFNNPFYSDYYRHRNAAVK
jgi:hypothetical protein